MNTYTISSHIADVGLRVEADTVKKLFLTSLRGMNEILVKNFKKHKTQYAIREKLKITSSDTTALLVDFLSEILTHCQIKKTIFQKVIFKELSENTLDATIYGIGVKSFDEDIKAVTYHEAKIVKNEKGNYETVIVFDI